MNRSDSVIWIFLIATWFFVIWAFCWAVQHPALLAPI